MTGLDLSEQQEPSPDGLRGRFTIEWKTIATGAIALFFALSAMERRFSDRVAAAESKIEILAQQNANLRVELSEIKADVKELLRRKP